MQSFVKNDCGSRIEGENSISELRDKSSLKICKGPPNTTGTFGNRLKHNFFYEKTYSPVKIYSKSVDLYNLFSVSFQSFSFFLQTFLIIIKNLF